MPISKNKRKNRKSKQSQITKQAHLLEPSPNKHLLKGLVCKEDFINLSHFVHALFSKSNIKYTTDEIELFDLICKAFETNQYSFNEHFVMAMYFRYNSTDFIDHVNNMVLIISEQLIRDCSEQLKKEVFEPNIPVDTSGLTYQCALKIRIHWYTAFHMKLIIDSTKAVYKSVFLEDVFKQVELNRKLANF